MSEEDRWAKVRQIVREENERLEERIVSRLKSTKAKIELVNGRWVGITQEQREAWEAAYGAVDLEAELRKAAAWCVSNPHLAPKSQIGRFLNTWFTRQQNQSSIRSIPAARPSPTASPPSLCEYCLRGAVGSVNGIRHCGDHSQDAMDMKPRTKMPGVVAKAVSGS